ncbi:substrate-binding domain-containing protein [Streptomyces sp. Tue 6430]|nr:substrate-binding domain-containing protein [Streptomyces sp. Tue 6430]
MGEGLGDHITFTDGIAPGKHPRALYRTVAYSVFTLVVNREAGVENLTVGQIRDLCAGEITNWSQLGGDDVPVHLVDRHVGSGTRSALVQRVLSPEEGDGRQPPQATVDDCTALDDDAYGVCEVDGTESMLETVSGTDGGFGYSEAAAAEKRAEDDENLVRITIAGQRASLDGVENGDYPYWQTELAYTYGEPPPAPSPPPS